MVDRPSWWKTNSEIKRELELPEYDPPKFADDVYVHEVVDPLSDKFDIRIQFAVINPQYPDDWYVWIDGEKVFPIGRVRNSEANTIFEMTSEVFQSKIESQIRTDGS